ncbi:MAG: phenylacetate--CoA ligase [Thermoplasmata archaeon]
MFFEPKLEKMRPRAIRELQVRRLRAIVRYAHARVPLVRARFKGARLRPESVKTLEDLRRIPFTVKDDLRDAFPYGLLAVPLKDVREFHASSGTTGKPTVVGYNDHDLETWKRLMARCYATAGAKPGDIVQNAYGYGLFTGGLGFHYGAQRLGLAVWPISGGNTKRQLLFMKDMKPTILASTPSYAMYLAEEARANGYAPKEDFRLRIGMFGAEPWSEEARRKIEDGLNIRANDCYGLSELYGPGVAMECDEQDGLHIWADEFLPEVIDPQTGEVLEPGEQGELVFTMLTRQAMPLLRYRTRDLSMIEEDECSCGRYHPRLRRIRGRSDDMLIIGGVNVFPSQIEHVLMTIEGVGEWYEIVVDRDILDKLFVRVEVEPKFYNSAAFDPGQLQQTISEELRAVLSIWARVELLKPGTIPRSEGKANRVLDLRKQGA